MRHGSPTTGFRTDPGWNVRLCQVFEIGLPLPETRELCAPVSIDLRYNQDTIFLTFAAQFLRKGGFIEEYAAKADNYWSPAPRIYHSSQVMWIDLWKGDHRGVIPIRMLANTRKNTPEASLFGIRLTEDTYRRLKNNNYPTATPATLPEEFRLRNRRALAEAAQHRAATEGEGTSGVTPGGATFPTDLPLESRLTEVSGEAGGT
eukprot:72066-Pleurochrysis_carterae.AAC.1